MISDPKQYVLYEITLYGHGTSNFVRDAEDMRIYLKTCLLVNILYCGICNNKWVTRHFKYMGKLYIKLVRIQYILGKLAYEFHYVPKTKQY